METINVREAREKIGRLLDAVTMGEEFVITRRGKPVAKLVKADTVPAEPLRFPDRSALRSKLPPAICSSAETIRQIRNDRF